MGDRGSYVYMPAFGHASNTRSPASKCIPSPSVYGALTRSLSAKKSALGTPAPEPPSRAGMPLTWHHSATEWRTGQRKG